MAEIVMLRLPVCVCVCLLRWKKAIKALFLKKEGDLPPFYDDLFIFIALSGQYLVYSFSLFPLSFFLKTCTHYLVKTFNKLSTLQECLIKKFLSIITRKK